MKAAFHRIANLFRISVPRSRQRQQGSGLIVVIWVIGLLSVLVVSFAFETHLETKVLSLIRKRHQAEYLALSGIQIAEMLLDKQSTVSGNESPDLIGDDRWYPWALLLHRGQPVHLVEKLGEGYIRLDIVPEAGRRNVNKFTDDDWVRILTICGIPENLQQPLINAVDDWIATSSAGTRNGAELEEYYAAQNPPYHARHGALDTVRELLLVKGFNEAILSGGVLNPEDPPEKQVRLSGIQDMLTTDNDDGKVNVNTASARVLKTLPGVDDLIASKIIDERGQPAPGSDILSGNPVTGFTSAQDCMSRVSGLDTAVAGMITTGMSVVRITTIGQVGQVTRRIWVIATYDAGGKKLKIRKWREET